MREKEADALVGAAISTVEQLEALIAMIRALNGGVGAKNSNVSTLLRELASMLDGLDLLENDLRVIKKRLRGMLSSDPDKTPRAMNLKELPSTPSTADETRFSAVEERARAFSRKPTQPGIGSPGGPPPLPRPKKKEDPQ